MKSSASVCALTCLSALLFNAVFAAPIPVTLETFARAESDLYFGRLTREGIGRFVPLREPTSVDHQEVVRMNRDTLYASAVFDLAAGPVTITLPDPGKRFMSMQVISEDHYTVDVTYRSGRHTYTQAKVGTRYVTALVRIFVDPRSPADLKAVNALQDAIKVEQPGGPGKWEPPAWEPDSQGRIREALLVLGNHRGNADMGADFGPKDKVDPLSHLIGTAVGWGGNPASDATYLGVNPAKNDGKTAYALTVKDVPVDGFWSISVYNKKGYFVKNEDGLYSLNSVTAKPNADGSYTIQFGGKRNGAANWFPIMPGWNYMVRLYRPRKQILDGKWKFPEATPL